MRRSVLLALLTLVAGKLSGASQELERGTVQGTVLDGSGRAVAHVKVYPIAAQGAYRANTSAITDDNGNFILRGLLPGQNRLFAVAPEAGYPDGRSGIFTGDPSLYEDVNVEPGRTLTGVTVKMPKKGAVFRAHIVDVSTGKPVLTSRIRITRADVPNVFFESGPDLQGRFEIVLVPNMPFRVEIRAANYKEWRYSRVDSHGRENFDLVLTPETTEEVTIKLQEVPPDQTQ